MPLFIRHTSDEKPSGGKRSTVYINLDYVASAQHTEDDGALAIFMASDPTTARFRLSGQEAKAAMTAMRTGSSPGLT